MVDLYILSNFLIVCGIWWPDTEIYLCYLNVYILLFTFRILFSYILWNGRGRWFYFFLCVVSSPNNTYWVIPLSTHFKVTSLICQASIFAFITSFYFVSLVLAVFFFQTVLVKLGPMSSHVNFRISLTSSTKNFAENLIEVALNL